LHLRRVQGFGVLVQRRVPRRVLLAWPPRPNDECEYYNGASVPDLQPCLGDDDYLNSASYDYDFASCDYDYDYDFASCDYDYDYNFASCDYSGTGNHYNDNGAG
jgi:hypothetical protein